MAESTVARDLFELDKEPYLLLIDHYSKFMEISELANTKLRYSYQSQETHSS